MAIESGEYLSEQIQQTGPAPSTARLYLEVSPFNSDSNTGNERYFEAGDLLQADNNLSELANAATARTNLGVAIGSDVQAHDAQLDDIAALAVTDGNFIVGDGVNWVAENGATVRTSLGLGTLATLNSPLPIANGGSGQTAQQAAIDALTAVSGATNEHILTKDTGTGNAIFKAAPSTSPGGSDTHIQFNDSGAFGGEAKLTWDTLSGIVKISDATSDSTTKRGQVAVSHYDTAEEDIILMRAGSFSSDSTVNFGGGSPGHNAVRRIYFNCAANTTTLNGTAMGMIRTLGWSIGHDSNATAMADIRQTSTSGAKPVLLLDQADVDQVLIKIVGTSDSGAVDRTLVKASDFPTPGSIVAWAQIEIDDERVGGITDGDYYIPIYSAPS